MTSLINNRFVGSSSLYTILKRCLHMKASIKTAGIIGDEILKGEVLDTNSNYITKALHNLGIKVQKISVIADTVDDICEETKTFSNKYDYVITTGGIGPTHDDLTFEGIAKAFNEELKPHPALVKIVSEFYKTTDLSAPGMKLAFVPESAHLTFGTDQSGKNIYPNVSVRNVYIFAGIPQLLQKSIDLLGDKLFSCENKFYSKKVFVNVTEQVIVRALEQIVKEFPSVMVGSYPELANEKYKVKITLESCNSILTEAATNRLLQLIPKDCVVKI